MVLISYTSGSTTFTNAMYLALDTGSGPPAVVELGEGWEVIGISAFQETNIISIEIPASLTSIENYAFLRADNFTTITFAGISELKTIGDRAFQETDLSSIEIPKSVTDLNVAAFENCNSLTTVTFAGISELETIGVAAFVNCAFSSITIPPTVNEIETFAFYGCSSLTSVIFTPDSQLATIGTELFNNSGLTSLIIPVSLLTVFGVNEGSGQTVSHKDGVTVLLLSTITSGTTGNTLVNNSGAGQTVYTIIATDTVGVTGYTLGGTDADKLSVSSGGVVTLDANPDYDTQFIYSFTVTASDAVGNTSSPVTVTFSILDPTSPTITSGTTGNDLDENSGAGQTVYTIIASDNVAVTGYTLGGTDASLLSVSSGGVVTLDADPDYETQSSYSFTVEASDAAGNTSTPPVTVTFSIINVDEIIPNITSGTTGNTLVHNSRAGQVVYTIIATDNVAVTGYTLGGTDASLLSVDSGTGEVTLTANPDYNTKQNYSFTVTASDAAGNTSSPVTVTFLIIAYPAPICFPAGTPVITDQGEIAIDKIDPEKHTINTNKIEGVTETKGIENYVVMIKKDAFSKTVPCRDTIISANHKIMFNNQMIQASEFVDKNMYPRHIYKIPYSGYTLYNVLLEDKHGLMIVNSLIAETLSPNSINAWLFRKLKSDISNAERTEVMDAYMQRLFPAPVISSFVVGCK